MQVLADNQPTRWIIRQMLLSERSSRRSSPKRVNCSALIIATTVLNLWRPTAASGTPEPQQAAPLTILGKSPVGERVPGGLDRAVEPRGSVFGLEASLESWAAGSLRAGLEGKPGVASTSSEVEGARSPHMLQR